MTAFRQMQHLGTAGGVHFGLNRKRGFSPQDYSAIKDIAVRCTHRVVFKGFGRLRLRGPSTAQRPEKT